MCKSRVLVLRVRTLVIGVFESCLHIVRMVPACPFRSPNMSASPFDFAKDTDR